MNLLKCTDVEMTTFIAKNGKNFVSITAFGSKEGTIENIERIENLLK